MKTYQDLVKIIESERDVDLLDFVNEAIREHMTSPEYASAWTANEYYCRRNVTISQYQKLLYTVTGRAVPDNYSANFKVRSNFMFFFVTQLKEHLLSNGATWTNQNTEKRLGKDFTRRLKEAAKEAQIGGVSYGFMNYDHLEVFKVQEFVPFFDEENGALMAGIRFWQIDSKKPLRATLYAIDGITECIWRDGAGEILSERKPYKIKVRESVADGTVIYDGENYPTFPIVPLWGINRQSELEGRREKIDCFDLIESGFANTIDDASLMYWTLTNAGGMRDIDLVKFVERMKTVHAASLRGDQTAESHSVEPPYNGREVLLTRLRKELFDDFMGFDIDRVASGSTVTAQINASYIPLDYKADEFEENIIDFIQGLLNILGIDDDPTFTRSKVTNQQEQVSTIVTAGEYLSDDYKTRKILTILGDGDQADDMLKEMDAEDMQKITVPQPNEQEEEGEQWTEGTNEPNRS